MAGLEVTRRFQFCAGHRVVGHEGKCKHLHGHNYVAYVKCVAPHVDAKGMVIDFGIIKDLVGGWIDDNWDHGFICARKDAALSIAVREFNQHHQVKEEGLLQKVFVMQGNPTAENMAACLLEAAQVVLKPHDVEVRAVTLWETENCYATVTKRSEGT